ncbi:MAG: hypothetical protein GF393_02620 [Armatimonadia bacterium]|nr:hypothetical protein [Armatimonadia bacterium]
MREDASYPQPVGMQRRDDNGARQRYVRAALMARKGHYADAARLLSEAHQAGECSDAEALDLQARIYAQQGFHLEAESCWRRAQSVDSSNPVYAGALHRLRQVHQPGPRVYGITAAAMALLVLGLLLWQFLFTSPGLRRRQETMAQSMTTMQGDIGALQQAGLAREQNLTAAMTALAGELRDLDHRLFARIDAMPTVSDLGATYEATVRRMNDSLETLEQEGAGQYELAAQERLQIDQRVQSLEEVIAQQVSSIDERQRAADARYLEQFRTITAMMEPVSERLRTIESTMSGRIDSVRSQIREQVKPLATAEDLGHLAHSVSQIQQELMHLAATLQELRQPAAEPDGEVQGGTEDEEETEGQDGASAAQSDQVS